jgi:hypothetical protein
VPDVRRIPQRWLPRDMVSVARAPGNNLVLDLEAEADLIRRVVQAAPALSLVHDVSDGGLETALREMGEWSGVTSDELLLAAGDVPDPDSVRFVLAGATVPDFAEAIGTV